MISGVAVIGGGIVGIALAREIGRRGLAEVTVFEKEPTLAAHQTGHNSGVVHAGLYYRPGTLKAQLCAAGREAIRDFCEEKKLPYREVGKLVVAVDDRERAALGEIHRRAVENRVPDLSDVLSPSEIREIEPHSSGVAAIHSPHTAVVDYSAITTSMADDVTADGGTILLGEPVTSLANEAGVVRVGTGKGSRQFARVVVCAGLQSDTVARMVGADPSPRILPFRGEYWGLSQNRTNLVRGMIYPVPDPRFPFLGVHFTRGVYDQVHVGPNAVPAMAHEGYRRRDISARYLWAALRWPGAAPLARQHWQMGISEIAGSLLKPIYYQRARRFVPELTMSDLVSGGGAGVRAQAWARDGSLLDDFAVDQVGRVTLVRNAPSPAATSSMAIANYLVDNYLASGP